MDASGDKPLVTRFSFSGYSPLMQIVSMLGAGIIVGWVGRSVVSTGDNNVLSGLDGLMICIFMVSVAGLLIRDNIKACRQIERNTKSEKETVFASLDESNVEQPDQQLSTSQQLSTRGEEWEESCRSIACLCGLSARESEVFLLLSRGRGARQIGESLCIAISTAKSHTYSIYRKCNVHSQQEIIDLVEERTSRALTP